ncbi:MAG: exo-alpha-sialidase [Fuerstiella sp.]|nr:exo-alpha-sialidase [Fuerstiella sp.]MCP4858416.1 exo-alpha-sialidase [Fuerstiella sp.]
MRSVFCLVVLLLPCLTMADEPFIEEALVWDFKEGGYDTHHVYGFAVTREGTVLAFSEGREKAKDDAGPKDQLLKRSTDGGRTWGTEIVIERKDGTYWNANGHPGVKETWTNCAPVVDRVTGNIFYFYALNDPDKEAGQRVTRVFYKKSVDDGLTWSDRVDVTGILNARKDGTPNKDANGNWILNGNGFPCDYLGRAMHMPGPGHGIQASDGRLILQFWNRTSVRNHRDNRLYGVTVIYSDDHGATWKFGGFVDDGQAGMNESRIVELEDGCFYVNARWATGGLAYRVVSTSLDSTLDKWTTPKMENGIPKSTTVDAGMIRLTDSSTHQKSRILWAKSNDFFERPKGQTHTYRNSMTVFMSFDEAQTWPVRKLLNRDWANYCDLAVLEDKTILLLWATGTGFEQQKVVCSRFNVEWLTDGKDSLTLKPQ